MRLSQATSLALLCSTAAASPLTASPLASKHNIYLATCTKPRSCLLIICNDPDPFTAAAYYPNGASTTTRPSELSTVSNSAAPWEGTLRQGRFRTGTLSANINAGAKTLSKGEIAGTATLGSEDYVCFRDGQSKFSTQSWDDLDLRPVNCVADYWCASTS